MGSISGGRPRGRSQGGHGEGGGIRDKVKHSLGAVAKGGRNLERLDTSGVTVGKCASELVQEQLLDLVHLLPITLLPITLIIGSTCRTSQGRCSRSGSSTSYRWRSLASSGCDYFDQVAVIVRW
jgi:hypothetical protein